MQEYVGRIPATGQNWISSYLHCLQCLNELPPGESPRSYQKIQAGFTKYGIQVWCVRHESNIMHIDFEGSRHPADVASGVGQ